MPRNAIGAIVGAVFCLIIAWLIAPLIPEPTVAHIIAIIAWIGLVLCAVLAIYYVVAGRSGTGPRV